MSPSNAMSFEALSKLGQVSEDLISVSSAVNGGNGLASIKKGCSNNAKQTAHPYS